MEGGYVKLIWIILKLSNNFKIVSEICYIRRNIYKYS